MMHPFDESDYADERFKRLNVLDEAIHNRIFDGCAFEECRFNGSAFFNCRFVDCTFQRCDLSQVRLPGTTFATTTFEESRLVGINWTELDWRKQGMLGKQPIGFRTCVLNYSSFQGASLKGLQLTDCVALEVDWEETDLSEAICTGTDFAGSRFVRTTLTRANFAGATNYEIDVRVNSVKGARFALPEAIALLRGLEIVLVE